MKTDEGGRDKPTEECCQVRRDIRFCRCFRQRPQESALNAGEQRCTGQREVCYEDVCGHEEYTCGFGMLINHVSYVCEYVCTGFYT